MLQQALVMITSFSSGVWANLRGPLLVPQCTCYLKVATGQFASTGMVALSYVQKNSDKVSLASDVMYNYMFRDVTTRFGYNYILPQCRHRGDVDSNGCVAAFLEEHLNMGLNFILPVEVDHKKKDYKFGFGLTIGEYRRQLKKGLVD